MEALDVRNDQAARVGSAAGSTTARPRYLPIAEHGLIGDLHTVALVGTDGTIDWYCCPRFDSPSVFGSILDADHGGLFRIAPEGEGWSSKQLYLPDTNSPRRGRRGAGAVLRRGRHRRVRGHRGVLAAVAEPVALLRTLARDGASLGAHAQAAHVRADRRDRRRAHDEPAGATGRGAELGLSLRVDARRRLHALRAAQTRLHRGGRRVHAVAGGTLPPRRRPRVGPSADHVRHRRARGSARAGAVASGGVHGLGAGADRQRGGDPTAARRLRRPDGRTLPLHQVRGADLPRRLDRASRATWSG